MTTPDSLKRRFCTDLTNKFIQEGADPMSSYFYVENFATRAAAAWEQNGAEVSLDAYATLLAMILASDQYVGDACREAIDNLEKPDEPTLD